MIRVYGEASNVISDRNKNDSLLFGAWTRLVFAAAALDGSFLVRNILADL